MIEKYFLDFFKKKINKGYRKGLNWINLKLRGLKWTIAKLKDWNEIWGKLEGQFCILAKNIFSPPQTWPATFMPHLGFSGPEKKWWALLIQPAPPFIYKN